MARVLVGLVLCGIIGYAKYSYRAERRAERQAQTQRPGRAVQELDHCVQICFRLSDNQTGTDAERSDLGKLVDRIDSMMYSSKLGQCDPVEVADGYFVLCIYGSSSKQIWEQIETDVRNASYKPGSYVVRTEGPQHKLEQIRIEL
jgi:hypothetical protein